MKATQITEIIDELQDIAKGEGAKEIRDFVYLALSSEQVIQTTNSRAISVIYRLTSLLEKSESIKEE